ncbi:MAG: drug exporter of the superfamily [Pseudonocardiales bacterium]|nr:drug exporter of the superfamily [Pseudonocardiales bacterium]
MSTFLYRLGQFSVRRRRLMIAGWLLLLVIVGALGSTFGKTATSALSIPGVESVQATNLLTERFPTGGAGGAAARVVVEAPTGTTLSDAEEKAAFQAVLAQVKTSPQVASVSDPYAAGTIAKDGSVGYASVQYSVSADQITTSSRDALLATATAGQSAGLKVEFGGEAVQENSATSSTEAIGILIALLVLAVTFGSVLAAGLPLLTALIGVAIGITGISAVSAFVDLSSTAPTLALMMGLAVGIDYALFIVSRHRQNLASGLAPDEAAARAVATAGGAVVFAGLTVIIALAGLAIVGIPFLTVMGLAAAGTVAVAVLVATTLVPALLAVAGTRLNRWRIPGVPAGRRLKAAAALEAGGSEPAITTNGSRRKTTTAKAPFGRRWAIFVAGRPVAVLVGSLIALTVVALPALSLRLGLPDDGTKPATSTARQAYDLLSDGFGPGFNGPLIVVVDAIDASNPASATTIVTSTLQTIPGVKSVGKAVFNPAANTATITVIPDSGPNDPETATIVHAIRSHQTDIETQTGARILVSGNTALGLDISSKLSSALPLFLIVVVGLALVLLTIVFRSIFVPIKATLGFLASIATTFGALVAVFQWGWLSSLFGVSQTGPVISFLPILLVALLFGLAMDYELFLVTRMREAHVHGMEAKKAVIEGFDGSARVVTAAAIIMMSVFAGFMLGDDTTIKSIGFALAFGVLVDAFVVRMTIVPAVMTLLGERAWAFPRWLDRIVPRVDIEGEALARKLELEADLDYVDPPVEALSNR